jgi:LemA protein
MNSINPMWIIIGVGVIIVLWFVSIYNKLVQFKNNRENAFADIDVQLKQRHDLIPQLVATVKGYASHEEGVLTAVTKARQKAVMANTVNDKIAAEIALTSAVSGFNMQMEAYPDLKANQNFMQLQEEMSDIENKLASATREMNNGVQKFPNNILAGMFGFKEQPYFDLGVEQREVLDKAPEINF